MDILIYTRYKTLILQNVILVGMVSEISEKYTCKCVNCSRRNRMKLQESQG